MEKIELSEYLAVLVEDIQSKLKTGAVIFGPVDFEIEATISSEAGAGIKYYILLGKNTGSGSRTKINLKLLPKLSDDDFSYLARLKNTKLI